MRKALIVGIDDYPNAELSGCVSDATSISNLLERDGDGSPNFSILAMTSPPHQITRSQLREAISKLFDGENDVALFYFAGHGMVNSAGGWIVTNDFKQYDEGISMDEILALANKSKSKDKVIILDCCHAGAFGNPAVSGSTFTQLSDGVTILTACRPTEKSAEQYGQGLFTSLLIDALYGGASDIRGYITPGSLYSYVDEALGPWDQRPVFKTNVSRFTKLRKVPPKIPSETLRMLTEYFLHPEEEHHLDPEYEDTVLEHKPDKVKIFKHLQKFVSEGLVKPVDEEYMYFAAINSKSCRLTALGYQYWRLVKEGKI
ncbi:caspase family protein [Paenibacillus sp. LjRoot56]|uniref:caspase family protein n=1 Tax=Paenibacillus sp. LjRoot56 TaxID=3342333 RepID=UPI003ED10932